MNEINSKKFSVRKYQSGWTATRRSDGFKIYFEDREELVKFVNDRS